MGVIFTSVKTHSGENPPDSPVHPGYPSIPPTANFIAKGGPALNFYATTSTCHGGPSFSLSGVAT